MYRYRLSRVWDETSSTVLWVMLNPSTATAIAEDSTIRRVIGFSRRWGHGRADVVNLFAFRTPNPCDLMKTRDPVGPDNDDVITGALSSTDCVVVAWGNRGPLPNPLTGVAREREVLELMAETRQPVYCLGWTAEGQPRHPLYLRSDATPILFT